MPEKFSERLKALRRKQSLTQSQAAELLGISPRYVAQIEAGKDIEENSSLGKLFALLESAEPNALKKVPALTSYIQLAHESSATPLLRDADDPEAVDFSWMPEPLRRAAMLRLEDLGKHYGSLYDYVLGLIRYDLLSQKDHLLTGPIARKDLTEQHRIDSELLELTKARKSGRGSLLEHLIKSFIRDEPTRTAAREKLHDDL